MIATLKQFKFKYFPIALIIAYVPFHLTEEALLNFPLWMYEHYGLPKPLSYPHWLMNNSFFLITLLVGLTIFLRNTTNYLSIGIGILIWGFMNTMEHTVFSILDLKFSPGFFTSIILFVPIAISGFINLCLNRQLNRMVFIKSIGIAFCYWIIPIIFIVSMGKVMIKVFP